MDLGRREGRPSQLQAPGEPVHSHDRASPKRCTSGASGGYGEENQTGAQVMRFLIMLEQTERDLPCRRPIWRSPPTERTSKQPSAPLAMRFGATWKPIEKPDNRCLKRKTFQTILRIPDFGICYLRTST